VLVEKGIFTVMYSETLQQPLWVKYQARPIKKVADRKGMDFYKEKEYITSDNDDYKGTVYDKGHMAPAAHFTDSKENLRGTFTYLNSALQRDRLNRGEWRLLEAEERKWADIQALEVHIKVVFGNNPKRVEGGAAIPDGFWKTIRFTRGDSTHIYYFPNGVPDKKWREYRIK
jgi:endonuclease G